MSAFDTTRRKAALEAKGGAPVTDQELKKLSRRDLLELLLAQARAALGDRQLRLEQAGSIAEAALQVNGVFEAAQAAAQQYLDNIRQRSEAVEAVCAQREAICARREEESRRRCQDMEAQAKEKADAYWAEVSARLQRFYQEHEALKQLLASGGKA